MSKAVLLVQIMMQQGFKVQILYSANVNSNSRTNQNLTVASSYHYKSPFIFHTMVNVFLKYVVFELLNTLNLIPFIHLDNHLDGARGTV